MEYFAASNTSHVMGRRAVLRVVAVHYHHRRRGQIGRGLGTRQEVCIGHRLKPFAFVENEI